MSEKNDYPRPLRRFGWMLPLLMLALAALACDEPYYDPIQVRAVDTDTNVSGRVYATVGSANQLTATYMTDDYGANWRPAENTMLSSGANTHPLSMRSETIYLNTAEPLWTFPRRTFRDFFLDDTANEYFSIPNWGAVSNVVADDAIFVAMGTEGVLVGPAPGTNAAREWTLTSSGMELIDPLPLTITNPGAILGVILWGLLMPPIGFMHMFILRRVWAYLLPPPNARRFALIVSLILMALAGIAIAIWLTNINVTYYGMVGVMTAIVALTGMIITYWLARRRRTDFTRRQRWALVILAGLVSLIVPAGVAAIWVGWWAAFGALGGYFFYHRAYARYFEQRPQDERRLAGEWTRSATPEEESEAEKPSEWLLDRMTLETIIVIASVVALSLLFAFTFDDVFSVSGGGLGLVCGFAVFILLASTALGVYTRMRVYRYAKIEVDVREAIPGRLRGHIIRASVMFPLMTFGAAIGTFIGQMMAYGWFTGLLVP
jgi:MFS family permease